VEYSYRQHEAGTYADGIFWLNAAESLDQGFARLARDLGLARTDQALDQQVRSAFDALGRWKKALLVLDNLEDPGTLNRSVVSGCIPAGLSCRLLFTTRRRDLGGFTPVEVTVLPEESALQLLLRHPNRQPAIDPGDPDHEPAVAITRMLGRLPLALELAGAHLGKWSDPDKPGFVSLSGYRERLRTKGRLATVDVGAKKLSDNELQSIHADAVEATLRQQWDALDDKDARNLLLVAGQLPEAAAIPNERLGLLAGVAVRSGDGEGPSPLDEALRRLEDDCLVEELHRDQVRLHPLVREFAERLTPAATRDAFRLACAGRMAAAYEDYATLEEMARKHPGVMPLEDDLLTALSFCPSDTGPFSRACNPCSACSSASRTISAPGTSCRPQPFFLSRSATVPSFLASSRWYAARRPASPAWVKGTPCCAGVPAANRSPSSARCRDMAVGSMRWR